MEKSGLPLLLVDIPPIPASEARAGALAAAGWRVDRAASNPEALERLEADPRRWAVFVAALGAADAAFGDGVAAAARAKGLGVPVLCAWDGAGEERAEEAAAAGAAGFVPADAPPPLLRGALSALLPRSASGAEDSRTAQDRWRAILGAPFYPLVVFRPVGCVDGVPQDYLIEDANGTFASLVGVDALSLRGRRLRDFLQGGESPWGGALAEAFAGGKPVSVSGYSRLLGRHYDLWIAPSAGGELVAVASDTTGRVNSEERFRLMFEAMSQGVVFQDAQGAILTANPSAERILGLSLDQLQGKTSMDPAWKAVDGDGVDLPGDQHPAMLALSSGLPVRDAAMGVFHPALGEHRWLRVDATPLLRRGESAPYGVFTLFTDVSDRRYVDDVRRFLAERGWDADAEDFFRALARFLAETLRADYVCIDSLDSVSGEAQTLAVYTDGAFSPDFSYALKDTPCGAVAKSSVCCFPSGIQKLFPNDPALAEIGAEGYAGIALYAGDGRPLGLIAALFRRPLDRPRMAETVLGLVSSRASGELERRDAQRSLAELALQRETLLKELQHRVKNNLNVVSGLLALEEDESDDEKVRWALTKARTRIDAMAAIYQRLYKSPDLATVDAGAYLRDLAAAVFEAYDVAGGSVRLEVDAQSLRLDAKRLAPLGLILNESISNALKYAFPAGRPGKLRVELRKEDTKVVFAVNDDGVGFEAGFDPAKAESMGLTLTRLLSAELRGRLSFGSGPGASLRLEFEA